MNGCCYNMPLTSYLLTRCQRTYETIYREVYSVYTIIVMQIKHSMKTQLYCGVKLA